MLFEQEKPKGLELQENYITPEKENELIEIIDRLPWLHDLKRRVQHYGYKYDYKARGNLQKLEGLPLFLREIDVGFSFNQVIINEYESGQGISPHIDIPHLFGNEIASLSLGSSCIMEFSYANNKIPVFLPQRSLITMKDEARYKWKHGIPARKSDNGTPRNRRISLTFRSII